ncbi:MAG: valine--tRNA ligase [archaeon]|nr:MAG: valine--tRNA ligase [archaeon]
MKKGKNVFDSKTWEKKLQEFWVNEKIFAFDFKSHKKIFSIDTPPPTVSGWMHVGHALSYTHKDLIARYKRMAGFNVLYPWGFDDNGLPTQKYVENKIGKKASDYDRDEFIEKCLKETRDIEEKLMRIWISTGISPDFDIQYRTIDERARRISQKSFIDLVDMKRAYRTTAPILWCPECRTAVAQVELEDKEKGTFFYDVTFELEKGRKQFTISTTRPEFLPACVAVFYHPDDKRYKSFKHERAVVPLFDLTVPVLEDKRVDMEKGSGIVMCCTFGDSMDIEWWKAYSLAYRDLLTEDGKMSHLAKRYAGKTIKEAREMIVKDLKKEKKITGERKIKHTVNVHERCGHDIEFVIKKQWFIKYLDLKDKFLELGNKVKWYPKYMKNRYVNWIKGLQWDWCISRQIPYGIPFPVWYCKRCDHIILANQKQLPIDPLKDNPPIQECPKCHYTEFIPEKDIINTWATSSLTPDIVRDIISKKNKGLSRKLIPFSLRPQAHDIIPFWAFNTIVKSWFHHKKIPWNDIMISGWGLDPKGKKMSKSKGNGIPPKEVIEKFSADALRFWAASVRSGEDVWFSEKEFIAAQKLITKMWNAFSFLKLHLKGNIKKPKKLEEFDKYMLLKTDKLVADCTKAFDEYDYGKVKLDAENFFWHVFCDNFLEILKSRLYGKDAAARDSARYVLYTCFLKVLKIFAPILSHITEAIYQEYFKSIEKKKSIHISDWPKANKIKDKTLEKKGDKFLEILTKVRQEKAKKNKSVKTEIRLTLPKEDKKLLKEMLEDLKSVTQAKEIKEGKLSINLL